MKSIKPDPEKDCFLCSKSMDLSFDEASLRFIQDLTLCEHHKNTTESALAKLDRQPGQEG